MFSDVHTDFILNPLTEVLADGVNASSSLPVGIENSALGEYFMQSLFLRMTGAQEQKMKCICWVMATNDYRYRYDLLNVKQYGECSEYKHKKGIYADLLNLIKGFDKKFIPLDVLANVSIPKERQDEIRSKWEGVIDDRRRKEVEHIIAEQTKRGIILDQEAKDSIKDNIMRARYPEDEWEERLFKEKKVQFVRNVVERLVAMVEHSPLTAWNYREFLFFKEHWNDVVNDKQLILSSNEFLGSALQEHYFHLVFEHRNRTAHNTASYLKDVPSLDTLSDESYVYKNYFFRFAILLLMDEVFMLMFKRYRELAKKRL